MSQHNNETASAPDGTYNPCKNVAILAKKVADWTKERDRLQGMIDAASAGQSITPVPRVGGNTSEELASWPAEIWLQHQFEYVPNFAVVYKACSEITWCQDSIEAYDIKYVRSDLAHVARQESAPVAQSGAAGVDTLPLYDAAYIHDGWQADASLYAKEADALTYGAQQREAGRRDRAILGHSEGLSFGKRLRDDMAAEIIELKAALSRQPVSEGLKPFAHFVQPSGFGPFIECSPAQVGSFPAYRAVPPAKAEEPLQLVSKAGNTQVWLSFKGGEVCLNNIAEDRGPVTCRAMLAAIADFLEQQAKQGEGK